MEEVRPHETDGSVAPLLALGEFDLDRMLPARFAEMPENGLFQISPVGGSDLVEDSQCAPGRFFVGEEAVLQGRRDLPPEVLVESGDLPDLALDPDRPVASQRVRNQFAQAPVGPLVDEGGIVHQIDFAAVEVHVAAEVHLPGGCDARRTHVAVDGLGSPGLLSVDLGTSAEPEDPEVPGVVDLFAGHDALFGVDPFLVEFHDPGDRVESVRGGEVEQADPDRVGQPVQDFAVRVGRQRLEKELVFVGGIAVAHEVELVLLAARARPLAGHDDMDVRTLGDANPVHPRQLGTEVVGVAVAARAVEEDAGPATVHALALLGGERLGGRCSGGGNQHQQPSANLGGSAQHKECRDKGACIQRRLVVMTIAPAM